MGGFRAIVGSHHVSAFPDPEAAFTWAANITDPDKQLATLKTTINAWKIYNPAAVRETLANSNLDEAVVAKLNAELK